MIAADSAWSSPRRHLALTVERFGKPLTTRRVKRVPRLVTLKRNPSVTTIRGGGTATTL